MQVATVCRCRLQRFASSGYNSLLVQVTTVCRCRLQRFASSGYSGLLVQVTAVCWCRSQQFAGAGRTKQLIVERPCGVSENLVALCCLPTSQSHAARSSLTHFFHVCSNMSQGIRLQLECLLGCWLPSAKLWQHKLRQVRHATCKKLPLPHQGRTLDLTLCNILSVVYLQTTGSRSVQARLSTTRQKI